MVGDKSLRSVQTESRTEASNENHGHSGNTTTDNNKTKSSKDSRILAWSIHHKKEKMESTRPKRTWGAFQITTTSQKVLVSPIHLDHYGICMHCITCILYTFRVNDNYNQSYPFLFNSKGLQFVF